MWLSWSGECVWGRGGVEGVLVYPGRLTNVVWGGLMAVWGGLMAVWGGLEVVWGGLGCLGVSMDRTHSIKANTCSLPIFFKC